MTNIAKREPKTKIAKKSLPTQNSAWGTFQDGVMTGIHLTRTQARTSGQGVAKKVTVQLASWY